MNSTTVLIGTWVLAAAVVGAYIWFVLWRVRADKRKKAAALDDTARMNAAIAATTARLASMEPSADSPLIEPAVQAALAEERAEERAEPRVAAGPATAAAAAAAPTGAAFVGTAPPRSPTVAGALAGINLPNDLTPLTMVADRPGVGDRVVFFTKTAPAETVGTAFGDELERLGYTVAPLDTQTVAATRGDQRLILVIHPDGAAAKIGDVKAFASVPDLSVVVEVWIP